MIGRVRPDVAPAAQRLLARLLERIEDRQREPVLIHGDANLRNALLLPDGERRAARPRGPQPRAGGGGPRAAARRAARHPHADAPRRRCSAATADPPDAAALRWHTAAALLARQALPAVSRFRPELLARLRELLDAGSALLAPKAVAA